MIECEQVRDGMYCTFCLRAGVWLCWHGGAEEIGGRSVQFYQEVCMGCPIHTG